MIKRRARNGSKWRLKHTSDRACATSTTNDFNSSCTPAKAPKPSCGFPLEGWNVHCNWKSHTWVSPVVPVSTFVTGIHVWCQDYYASKPYLVAMFSIFHTTYSFHCTQRADNPPAHLQNKLWLGEESLNSKQQHVQSQASLMEREERM